MMKIQDGKTIQIQTGEQMPSQERPSIASFLDLKEKEDRSNLFKLSGFDLNLIVTRHTFHRPE